MRNHRGRTWDTCRVILPDGREIKGHLDTTWSSYFYFEVDGVWRNAEIFQFEKDGSRFDLIFDLTRPAFDPMSVRR